MTERKRDKKEADADDTHSSTTTTTNLLLYPNQRQNDDDDDDNGSSNKKAKRETAYLQFRGRRGPRIGDSFQADILPVPRVSGPSQNPTKPQTVDEKEEDPEGTQ